MPEELSQEGVEAIGEALVAGRKIEAIKIYRRITGKDLKSAKEFIDALVPPAQGSRPS